MSLAAGSARTLLLRMITLAVQVPTSILLARLLGVEGKGLYTLLTVVPWLTAFLLLTGQDTAQTWVLSSRRARLGPVLRYCMVLLLVTIPLASAVYLWGVAPRVVDDAPRALVLASAMLIPLVLARYQILGLILGFERAVRFNGYYLATSIVVLVLVVVLAGVMKLGLAGALSAFIAAQALVIPLGIWWVARSAAEDSASEERGRLSGLDLARSCLAYGLKGHPAGILATFNQRFDIFLLGALSDPGQIGLYAVAVALAETLWHVPMSIHLNLFPRVSAEGADESVHRLPRAFRMTLLLSLGLAILLLALGKPLISLLFGADFEPAYRSLVLLLPGVLAVACGGVFDSYFAGINRRQYQSYSAGAAFAVSVALGLWLIPRWGAPGAALASTVSYTLQMVISISLGARAGARFGPEYLAVRLDDVRDLYRLALSLVRGNRGETR